MISQLSALEREIGNQTCYKSQTAGGQREIRFLLKKSVNLQYFAKFVSCTKGHQKLPYILESNPHLNLIRTSFCRFLKRKKKS